LKPADLQKLKGKTIEVRNKPGGKSKFGGGRELVKGEGGAVPLAVKLLQKQDSKK